MQYGRQPDGSLQPLPRPCLDTGMGLERIASVMQGVQSNYETDLMAALVVAAQQMVQRRTGALVELCGDANAVPPSVSALRVIADHLRASAFLVADGVAPKNVGRGYVLRRIIRCVEWPVSWQAASHLLIAGGQCGTGTRSA